MSQFLLIPILSMVAFVCLPSRLANAHAKTLRQFVTKLAGLQFLMIAGVTLAGVFSPATREAVVHLTWPIFGSLSLSVHFDMVASLMLLLVSFVGWVICRYSIRYLDGDPNQGRFFRWVAFTLGSVLLLVLSGNLLVFFGAWVMTSFGLHQLLLHYPDRKPAQRAAWTKFVISRIGDCFLMTAILLVYWELGTFEFDQLFASAASISPGIATAISWCLVLGALTKSAQFPLHSWLPETMETPTPVSALMHAGIVNAGGYLVIRLSPIIVQAPGALIALAIVGATTVCFAGIVMMTQSSIKRSLAYSTIAQMGFMMLQCGLGAFSAAMLHIIAHSLYKAYAFLNSGSVLAEATGTRSNTKFSSEAISRPALLVVSMAYAIGCLALWAYLLDINLAEKSGGLALGLIFCLALVAWVWDVLKLQDWKTIRVGYLAMPLLAGCYLLAFLSVNSLIRSSIPVVPTGASMYVLLALLGIAFSGLLVIQWMLSSDRGRELLAPVYVHVSNGFYTDVIFRRAVEKVVPFKL